MRVWAILGLGAFACLSILTFRWTSARRSIRGDQVQQLRTEVRPAEAGGSAERPQPLRRGETVPDADLVDHESRPFRLSDARGKVVVLAFIFTHCNVPSMCPLAASKIFETRDLARNEGLSDVLFVLASFDSERDGPARLKEFGQRYSADLADIRLVSGAPDQIGPLSRAFNTHYLRTAPDVFEHNIVVSIVDRDGRLRDDFFGTGWEPEELLAAIIAAGRGRPQGLAPKPLETGQTIPDAKLLG